MYKLYENEKYERQIQSSLDSILKINEQIRIHEQSREYSRITMYKNLKKHLKNRDFKRIIQRLRIRKNMKRLPIDLVSNKPNSNIIMNYFSNERVAIYTVLFGKYDEINEPLFKPDNCDFFIITDQNVPDYSIWKKINIDKFNVITSKFSDIEKNRFFKMNPHKVFDNHKYSVYIDSNILIVGDLTAMINRLGNVGLGLHSHRHRDCIYSEAESAEMLGKIDKEQKKEFLNYMNKVKFPKHYGLLECNVIAREHFNPRCIEIMEIWWNEFINSNIKRDQLHLPVAVRKSGEKMDNFDKLGSNVYENNLIRVLFHN